MNFEIRKEYVTGACVIVRCIEEKITVIRSTASGGNMVLARFDLGDLNFSIGVQNRKLAGLPLNMRDEQTAICQCLYDLRKKITAHEEIIHMYQGGLL